MTPNGYHLKLTPPPTTQYPFTRLHSNEFLADRKLSRRTSRTEKQKAMEGEEGVTGHEGE